MTIHYEAAIDSYWPDYDPHPLVGWEYQRKRIEDMDVGIRFCRQREVVLQAGGHVGWWPRRLALHFRQVYTFECEPNLGHCLARNTELVPNIDVTVAALGAMMGTAQLNVSINAGRSRIGPKGKTLVKQVTVDSLELTACDMLMLDIEGYELEALKGAQRTIAKFKPVLYLEINDAGVPLRSHLKEIGYREIAHVHFDYIFLPLQVP